MREPVTVQDAPDFPGLAGFRLIATGPLDTPERIPVRLVHPDGGITVTFAPFAAVKDDWYQLELRFAPDGIVDVMAYFEFADGRVLWQRMPVLARNHVLAQFRLDSVLERLTLRITGSGRLTQPQAMRFARVGLAGQLGAAAKRGAEILKRDGVGVVWSALDYFWRLTRPGSIVISRGSASEAGEAPYETWMRVFDEHPERDRVRHDERLASLKSRPLISVLANHTPDLSQQFYRDFEIAASLEAVRGQYVLTLPDDAVLRPHALLDLAMTLERHPLAELVYTDEDSIDAAGNRSEPRFKPAWSPDFFAASDYIGGVALLRTATARALGGEPHDLVTRVAANAASQSIVHLAKVLVHRKAAPLLPAAPTKPAHAIPSPAPRVSLVIPTRDHADVLGACIRSIRKLTRYPDYEILVIDNGSVEDATKKLFAELAADPAIRILPRPVPFNYSALNNSAVREATGAIVGLVNNDIEAADGEWLTEMVALAARPDVGCVGGRLLYPDRRLQHGGVIVGLGGVAGHAHRFAPPSEPGDLGRLRVTHEVSAVTAACLLIRRDVFDQVGGLDEELQVAFNDVDFCLKVRATGYRNLWTPRATLIHHESASRGRDFTPAKAKRFAGEYATMQRRWGADLLADPYYSPHLTYDREDFSVRLR